MDEEDALCSIRMGADHLNGAAKPIDRNESSNLLAEEINMRRASATGHYFLTRPALSATFVKGETTRDTPQ